SARWLSRLRLRRLVRRPRTGGRPAACISAAAWRRSARSAAWGPAVLWPARWSLCLPALPALSAWSSLVAALPALPALRAWPSLVPGRWVRGVVDRGVADREVPEVPAREARGGFAGDPSA